jgi:chromosome segregation ATPase
VTRIQINERDRLVSKHQAALLRFPKRSGPEFSRELQAIVRDLESLALEADASSNNVAERARTWSSVSAAYFDLAAGDPELEYRASAARSRAEQLVPTTAADQVEQLRSIFRESVEQGKVRSSREGLLEDVLAELTQQVQRTDNTEPDLRDVRSRLTELMKSMSHLVRVKAVRPCTRIPEERGCGHSSCV